MDSHEKKLLFDVLESGRSVRQWCEERDFGKYEADRQLRRAVEREFEIIGEALNRLSRLSKTTAARIPALPRIVGFRNRIIHGYDTIDDAAVWGIVQSHLPQLLSEVEALLREGGESV
jgi:uncharacterized protein with HEPN domain